MNATKRRAIYETLQSLDPHPTTELEFNTPFELLIAVMLSAQATDVSVNKAMRRMFPVANTPETLLALGEEGVADYIKTIGLYRTKAKNVIATCRILKLGRSLMVYDIEMTAGPDAEIVAHATGTYSIPPKRDVVK